MKLKCTSLSSENNKLKLDSNELNRWAYRLNVQTNEVNRDIHELNRRSTEATIVNMQTAAETSNTTNTNLKVNR